MTKGRILQYIENKGLSKSEFYEKTDLKRGLLDADKLNSSVSDVSIAKILAAFPDLDITWLLTGKGSMLKDSGQYSLIKSTANLTEGIPLIPVSAMAGAFSGEIQVLEAECDRYVVPSFKGADFLITAKGNSMSPTYDSGDMVACKKLSLNDLFFQWNKVYVIDTDQGVLIKRVMPGKDENHILIVSDNPNYPAFPLHRKKIYHIALVVGVIRLE